MFMQRGMAGIHECERQGDVPGMNGLHDRLRGVPSVSTRKGLVGKQGTAVPGVEPAVAGRGSFSGRQDARVRVVADLLG